MVSDLLDELNTKKQNIYQKPALQLHQLMLLSSLVTCEFEDIKLI